MLRGKGEGPDCLKGQLWRPLEVHVADSNSKEIEGLINYKISNKILDSVLESQTVWTKCILGYFLAF